MTQAKNDTLRNAVRQHYGNVAKAGKNDPSLYQSCCPGNNAKETSMDLGYSQSDVNRVPEGSNMGLGCGNPRAIASLRKGETVLDLGSGGGFDCFLAAKEVGLTGNVIGVDMTADMVSKARTNAPKTEYQNVEFRLGEIEHLPVANDSIDVIISNCVINLSPDKASVFQEAYRVLQPGGRLAISDIIATAELPEHQKNNMELFTGCMGGVSLLEDIENILKDSGFQSIKISPKNDSREFIRKWAPNTKVEDYVVSAYIEAIKP